DRPLEGLAVGLRQAQPPAHEAEGQAVAQPRRDQTVRGGVGTDVDVAVEAHGGMVAGPRPDRLPFLFTCPPPRLPNDSIDTTESAAARGDRGPALAGRESQGRRTHGRITSPLTNEVRGITSATRPAGTRRGDPPTGTTHHPTTPGCP